MTAQPIGQDDPHDPEQILRRLPKREHEDFLRGYREAVEAAHKVAGYRRLQEFLHRWSLVAVATSQPDYYQRMEEARTGAGEYVSLEEVIAEHGPVR
jgi:hypothetical protein